MLERVDRAHRVNVGRLVQKVCELRPLDFCLRRAATAGKPGAAALLLAGGEALWDDFVLVN